MCTYIHKYVYVGLQRVLLLNSTMLCIFFAQKKSFGGGTVYCMTFILKGGKKKVIYSDILKSFFMALDAHTDL